MKEVLYFIKSRTYSTETYKRAKQHTQTTNNVQHISHIPGRYYADKKTLRTSY